MKKILVTMLIFGLVLTKRVEAISPDGYWDNINCEYASGWVVDTDKINETTVVHVYSDRREDGNGGFFWGSFEAGLNRSDLPFSNKEHGFRFVLPEGLKNGREHEVWMYGIDLTGDNHLFMGKKMIMCDGGDVALPKSNLPNKQMYWIDPYKIKNNQYANRFFLNNKSEFEDLSSRQFFLIALQGLVNRSTPRIYVSDTSYDLTDLKKDYWKTEVEKEMNLPMVNVSDNDPFNLVEIFKNEAEIRGLALYDKDVWTSFEFGDVVNLLTGYCAVNSCIPVTTEIEAILKSRNIGWPVIADFRGVNSNNPIIRVGYSWNHEGIYRYISEMLINKANQSVLGYLQPQLFILPRDYFFAHKIIPVFIRKDASTFEEESLIKLMEKGIKPMGLVLGQAGSHNSDWNVPILGKYGTPIEGKYEEGINEGVGLWPMTSQKSLSLTYIHASPNLSVHSGFKKEIKEPNKCREEQLENNKVYLNFNLSDGDNISWVKQLWRESWEGEARSQPLTWSYNPIMADLQPLVLKWFFDNTGKNDSWISWGGFNSIENSKYNNLDKFVLKSCGYLTKIGSKKTYLTFGHIKPETITVWAKSNCFKGILSDYNIWLGYGDLPQRSYNNATYIDNGVMVARPIINLHLTGGQSETDFVNQLNQYVPTGRPVFLNIWVLGNRGLLASRQQLEGIISRLDENIYKVVGVDDFMSLYRQSKGLSVDGVCDKCTEPAGIINEMFLWYSAFRNRQQNNQVDFDCNGKIDINDLIIWYGVYKKNE